MFIYHYVSISFSLTNIYPLQGEEVRDQPGLVNQPSLMKSLYKLGININSAKISHLNSKLTL